MPGIGACKVTYQVHWTIDVDAENPRQAIEQARHMMPCHHLNLRRIASETTATVFEVDVPLTRTRHVIDLLEKPL